MGYNITFTLLSCLFFMGLVAFIAYRQTRGETESSDGYFLAGRGLGAPIIAGSLLLTNLSAEQLIGLNGSAYGFNLSSMAWEVTAAVATVFMANNSGIANSFITAREPEYKTLGIVTRPYPSINKITVIRRTS